MEENKGSKLWVAILLIIFFPLFVVFPLVIFGGGGSEEDKAKASASAAAACGDSGSNAQVAVNVTADAPEMVKKYAKDLESASNASGIPASYLAAQIEAESNWTPSASSGVAYGLTQFTKDTWAMYGEGDPNNPASSIKAQGKYMGVLNKMYPSENGKYDLAFAAYNAGPGNVDSYGGIPPFKETQNYVAKINALQPKYAQYIKEAGVEDKSGKGQSEETDKATDKASESANAKTVDNKNTCGNSSGNGKAIADGKTSGQDDYPFKDMAHCNGSYSSCPSTGTALGFFPSECVDFAAWRVNQQLGGTATDIKFDNTDPHLGNANTWLSGWQQMGWAYGNEPKVGAVVWYDTNHGGASSMGHVAVVKSVNDDGTYVEEGYNGNPAPNDHVYYTRTVSNDTPSKFLYVQK